MLLQEVGGGRIVKAINEDGGREAEKAWREARGKGTRGERDGDRIGETSLEREKAVSRGLVKELIT